MEKLKNIPNHIKVAISAWISRIGIALIQVFTIRILLSYLGEEKYAVYVILYSLLIWCNLSEFGVSSSLQNYISESRVTKKDYQPYLRTSLQIIIILFSVSISLMFLISYPLQNFLLSNYLHLNELKTINVVFVISVIFIILAFVNISIRILYAMQKGVIPNILQLLSYIVSAVSIFILNRYFPNNNFIILALLCFSLPQIFIMIIPFIKIFGKSFKDILVFDKDISKQIIIRAVKFEGIAVMTTILFQAEYIIMAKTLSPNLIVTYNVFKKVFVFVAFIYTSLLTAFWPVSNELFNSLQYVKLKKMLFKYCSMGIMLVVLYILCAFIFKDFILHVLAPKENIVIGFSFFALFIIYYTIRVISDTYSMFLQSINVLKIFWIYTPFRALISVTAQYFLSLKFGINGIVLGFILAFACTSLWICPYKSYKILSYKTDDIEK